MNLETGKRMIAGLLASRASATATDVAEHLGIDTAQWIIDGMFIAGELVALSTYSRIRRYAITRAGYALLADTVTLSRAEYQALVVDRARLRESRTVHVEVQCDGVGNARWTFTDSSEDDRLLRAVVHSTLRDFSRAKEEPS